MIRDDRAMTRLPTTIAGAEMLDYARDLLVRISEAGEVDSPFEAIEGQAIFRKLLRLMLMTSDGRSLLVALAQAGETDARIVLRETIAEARSWHRELPVELEFYELQLLGGPLPAAPAGQQPKDRLARDIAIAFAVAVVCDRFGLKPTQSSVRKRSGCKLIAEALDVVQKARSYDLVRSIWRRYGRAMPTQFGWVKFLES